MSTAVPVLSADDLLALPDAERFELVDGQLVERHMSLDSSWVAGEIFGRLRNYGLETGNGWAFPDGTSYQCFRGDFETIRRPDASYIVRTRVPVGMTGRGHCRTVPDLAVEVVSPGDIYYEIEDKVDEYLEAGVRQVWVVSPRSRQVTVHIAESTPRIYQEADELTGGDLLPGFCCRVGDLFPPWQEIASTPGVTG